MFNKPLVFLGVCTTLVFSVVGCAGTGHIVPQYISTDQYASYDCAKLQGEFLRVENYVVAVQKEQGGFSASGLRLGLAATNHHIYPTLSFGLDSNKEKSVTKAKLSRLYGERDAIIQSARLQKCSFANGEKVYGEV